MKAEIVTIGTELLLGEIVDTNSAYIARAIRDIGLDLFYQTTVGDNQERAAAAISAALGRADVVITTGGLGPTVDDVTRPAVAEATDRELEFRPNLLEQIAARFRRWGAQMSDNNRQQAFVPAGALGLENPVGTAPCFAVETERGVVISLPGVPREMIYMMENVVIPYLQEKMGAPAVILARVLRTSGIGESQVDSLIQDLERLSNPTVGLAAHAGQTDIRVTAKATSVEEAEKMIESIVKDIRDRLGINIYGEGSETVEEIVLDLMRRHQLSLALVEVGTEGATVARLQAVPAYQKTVVQMSSFATWEAAMAELELALTAGASIKDQAESIAQYLLARWSVDVALVVGVKRAADELQVTGVLTGAAGERSWERGFGGPPAHLRVWAATRALDTLRRRLLKDPPSSGSR